jgi:HD-GYP domain-containing protein (c-di-GMP phosphodiesterase class II)/HAMP domain-containing protein
MRKKRFSLPLYLYFTLLAVGLVIITGQVLLHYGDLLPGMWEFVLLVFGAGAIALLVSRRIVAPLSQLAREAEAARRFDFSDHPLIRSQVREIDELGAAFDLMRDAVRRFLRLNRRLAMETDFETLRPWLLDKLVDIADAKGGVLYLMDAVSGEVKATALDLEGAKAKPAHGIPPLQQHAMPGLMQLACSRMQPLSGQFKPDELIALGLSAELCGLNALALPLCDRNTQMLGMLLLFKDGEVDPANISFIEALTASAITSLETQELFRAQKAMVEATIHMVANAIDAKSQYTGGHCSRVPELTFMLARAACDAKEGPYADFNLTGEQWEALHIAGWLHDCGKVTTPEYVVDKATKLETIYNRIHEIRTRFEVLKRDADIAYWRGLAEGGAAEALAAQRDALWAQLDAEFAFVARCNVGAEFFSQDDQKRLQDIASRRWLRTLDNQLGLSRDELARYPEQTAPLPVEEALLADLPQHRIPRPASECIAEDHPLGFKMTVPELLYHHGELHDLCISRGTLTEEERYKINQHIVQTIIMLSGLPLPKHLHTVPDIAGGHHEKMDGTGYPRRLQKEQLKPEARMMAIADIFEALTAGDRPYKQGKTLSEAMGIMAKMCQQQHIDAELFELFLRSGVYRDYAQRYMKPEQMDDVDVDALLAEV